MVINHHFMSNVVILNHHFLHFPSSTFRNRRTKPHGRQSPPSRDPPGENSSRRVRNQNGGIFCLYLKNPIDTIWMRDEHTWFGFSHLEKYESQWEGWSDILWKKMFQTANQIHLPAILGLGTFVFWHIAMERKNQTGPTGHQSGGRWTSGNCTLKIYWFTEYLLSMV